VARTPRSSVGRVGRPVSARSAGVFLHSLEPRADSPREGYPYDLPAVRQIRRFRFGQVTLLVGDNGSGKSTITEAIAVKAGFNAEGGGRNLRFSTFASHSDLHKHVELAWNRRPRWGWFLRAETFYGMATHITNDDDPQSGIATMFGAFHSESHGESFLDLALSRFMGEGLYILDEPESALSVQGQLTLLRLIHESCREGSQFIVATHSPLLMAYPSALIYLLDEDGPRKLDYDAVPSVQLWRRFLKDPASVLDQLFAEQEETDS
jgi:predicted ATPase